MLTSTSIMYLQLFSRSATKGHTITAEAQNDVSGRLPFLSLVAELPGGSFVLGAWRKWTS